MSIFNKKYDLREDYLRKEFDIMTKQYVLYYGQTIINYTDLNRRTQKYLDSENQRLRIDNSLLNSEIYNVQIRNRRRYLNSLGYSDTSFEYLGPVDGTIAPNLQNYLYDLVNEHNVLIGIHRVSDRLSNEQIMDILTNGLIMSGHLMGAVTSTKSLGQNVSYYPDNRTIIKELMYADQYKNSCGSILIRIPDEDLTGNIYITDNDGLMRLNPKYIIGYVPLYPDHHLESIITCEKNYTNNFSEEIMDKHT